MTESEYTKDIMTALESIQHRVLYRCQFLVNKWAQAEGIPFEAMAKLDLLLMHERRRISEEAGHQEDG